MRSILIIGTAFLAVGCSAQMPARISKAFCMRKWNGPGRHYAGAEPLLALA